MQGIVGYVWTKFEMVNVGTEDSEVVGVGVVEVAVVPLVTIVKGGHEMLDGAVAAAALLDVFPALLLVDDHIQGFLVTEEILDPLLIGTAHLYQIVVLPPFVVVPVPEIFIAPVVHFQLGEGHPPGPCLALLRFFHVAEFAHHRFPHLRGTGVGEGVAGKGTVTALLREDAASLLHAHGLALSVIPGLLPPHEVIQEGVASVPSGLEEVPVLVLVVGVLQRPCLSHLPFVRGPPASVGNHLGKALLVETGAGAEVGTVECRALRMIKWTSTKMIDSEELS